MRARLDAWARRRQGIDVLPLTLQSRRIYILPTRAGWGFALLLLVMLVAALNYNNSLGLFATFLLGSHLLVGLHQTHAQLRQLQVLAVPEAEYFAGRENLLTLQLANPDRLPRLALCLRTQRQGGALADLPAAPASGELTTPLHFEARGLQPLPRLELQSRAPLGLLRTWSWLHLEQRVLVYPRPAGDLPLPASGGDERQESAALQPAGSEEWRQLRPWQLGDAPRSVAWKHYARRDELLVTQFQDPAGAEHVLDFGALGRLGTEARLEQLCAWVLECEQRRQPYVLRLPGLELHAGLGGEQRQRALAALARFGVP